MKKDLLGNFGGTDFCSYVVRVLVRSGERKKGEGS